MLTPRLLIFTLIICGFVLTIHAQHTQPKNAAVFKKPVSNLHQKFIPVKPGIVAIDSFSIIPKTFFIPGIADSMYVIDYVNSTIAWKQKPNLDSVLVTYRAFPYKLNAVVKRLDYERVENNFIIQPNVYNNGPGANDNFFNFGNITYNGSFGRAISFGNSQDAVVTSNLNLQIRGYLADSIEIAAAITDNNIPIQPDGTTAELNDFDQIFLQFKKKNWALSMGDIDLRQNQNYFLNFYKRLRGASLKPPAVYPMALPIKRLSAAQLLKENSQEMFSRGRRVTRAHIVCRAQIMNCILLFLPGPKKFTSMVSCCKEARTRIM